MCGHRYDEHTGEDRSCPDGSGRTFLKHVQSLAGTTSFGEPELDVLEFILKGLMRGGDPRMATRHKAFPGVCRKIQNMKAQVARRKQERDAG